MGPGISAPSTSLIAFKVGETLNAFPDLRNNDQALADEGSDPFGRTRPRVADRKDVRLQGSIFGGSADRLACYTNKQIAWRLGVSTDTIKANPKQLFAKLRVDDRTRAVTAAGRRVFIEN
ncbi:LuxR C-terminal-related transcriptional regulator [Sphingomonas sp. HF-S4]|uniref:LuxR C-terminal-related transcriptional regulator n=1 Tax=Sphingomonas agrestis TaxID=3080540 RepID=A0ABU3YDE9_9SPHN|nr:LuxR C-terminal-related transcriptional regulator [Sphingomonas sp. HF-S4]MDV3459203.1 LuxR C-terminal-related transcriptional regulator [Sphingomonas sp. HF-S4]